METFQDFIEKVRDANPIEEVIQESGYPLRGRKLMRGARSDCDSLNVRTDWGRAWWYSHNWQGDVFAWVQREKGCDFMGALEILARRAGLELPKFQNVNEGEVRRQRAAADIFTAAAAVFQRWLVGDKEKNGEGDKDALAYAHSRGWTDETIAAAMVGFSGRKAAWQAKDMVGEFALWGIDPGSPQAVAVTGFQGDVAAWAKKHELGDDPDFDMAWVEKGRIHGLMDTPGIVYVHQRPTGKVIYLSRRQLPGFDAIKDGRKTRAWKSFNPQRALAGPKQFYYNHVYRPDAPCILVEGQGDAITWGQWGQASVALCGLLGDFERKAGEERDRILREVNRLKKHPALYLSLDEDQAGQEAIRLAGKLFGPTVQVVRESKLRRKRDIEESMDA